MRAIRMVGHRVGSVWAIGALSLLLTVGCEEVQSDRPAETFDAEPGPVWHAVRLMHGDFRTDLGRSDLTGIPYHLVALIEMGDRSIPVLVDLLYDDTPTPYEYYSALGFGGGRHRVEEGPARTATIGDIADYALMAITGKNVGYRSYLSEEERAIAISRWRDETGYWPMLK